MGFLKNKHFIMAMVIAPVLAVIAYFATDYVVSEPPQEARPGQSYKLAAKSNCRYQSGICTLNNGDVELRLRAERLSERTVLLALSSGLEIQNALISIASSNSATSPTAMSAPTAMSPPEVNSGPAVEKQWQLQVEVDEPEKSNLRLAVNIAGATYYAEIPAVFIDYETTFSRENFSPGKG